MKKIQVTPRLEHVRTFPITVSFDVLAPQKQFRLLPCDGAQLLDVFISLNTGPSPLPLGSATEYRYPEAVQIRIDFAQGEEKNSIDITSDLLNKMRSTLDSLDHSKLEQRYKAGMEGTASALIPIWRASEISIAAARQKIDDRLAVRPLSAQLTTFGTRSAETLGGALALSNYLYTFIPLQPVSLDALLSRRGIEIQTVLEPCISITHGEAPVVGGVVNVLLEGVYHNELIDEFDRLEHQIKTRLLEIHQKLASDGPIVQGIAQTNNNVAQLVRQLNDFDAALQDQGLQIQSITRSNTSTMTTLGSRIDKLEQALKKLNIQVTP